MPAKRKGDGRAGPPAFSSGAVGAIGGKVLLSLGRAGTEQARCNWD